MDSTRQKKFARLIQKDLGEIFQRNATNWFNGAFITVTLVKITPDLKLAKVYLSFLLVKNKEELLMKIQEHGKQIRQTLGNRIRHQARVIPELKFFIDDTEDVAAEVDKLFDGLNIPPEKDEEKDKGDKK